MSGVFPFLIPLHLELPELLAILSKTYAVRQAAEEGVEALHFDTFDWRLSSAGLAFWRQGKGYRLSKHSGEEIARTPVGARRKKLFWWDLPQGELADNLRPIIGERALTLKFTLSGRLLRYSLLNSDDKTVARFTVLNYAGHDGAQPFTLQPLVLVEQLKGYERASSRMGQLLLDSGLTEVSGGYDLVSEVQKTLQIDPKSTDSKFSVELGQGETVALAVRDICLHLLSTMRMNVAGTLDDIDSEFLHDLRVSVRRTRSLLALLKKQLPEDEVSRFQAEFKWVGNVTGPVRDLDVYLLKEREYRELLPEELQAGLTCFFADLSRRRKGELRRLRNQLRSPRFTGLLETWESFLRTLPSRKKYPAGKRLCREVVNRIINKRLNRILRQGAGITPLSPVEKLHELRIEGKKFRYLLEFFRTLYDQNAIDEYLKQMKRLQNTLGDFNDLVVQKAMLLQQLQQLGPGDPQGVETAGALGGLIVHLYDQQRQVRGMFEETFASFATVENVGLMQRILTDAESQSSLER